MDNLLKWHGDRNQDRKSIEGKNPNKTQTWRPRVSACVFTGYDLAQLVRVWSRLLVVDLSQIAPIARQQQWKGLVQWTSYLVPYIRRFDESFLPYGVILLKKKK